MDRVFRLKALDHIMSVFHPRTHIIHGTGTGTMRRSTFRQIFLLTSIIIIAESVIPVYSSDNGNGGMISGVGIAILAATVMAFIGHLIRQPLILAYIAAGIIIGPEIGFGFVSNMSDIETISHFGLILLLFLIGLEIDIKKLRDSGRSLIAGGLTQFPI
ncbi:MAG TPA: cation:proton antiporter, partial [Spirochaetota bacterium]|nr:cation:proton antiporter [Spirochaetota bacterium]